MHSQLEADSNFYLAAEDLPALKSCSSRALHKLWGPEQTAEWIPGPHRGAVNGISSSTRLQINKSHANGSSQAEFQMVLTPSSIFNTSKCRRVVHAIIDSKCDHEARINRVRLMECSPMKSPKESHRRENRGKRTPDASRRKTWPLPPFPKSQLRIPVPLVISGHDAQIRAIGIVISTLP